MKSRQGSQDSGQGGFIRKHTAPRNHRLKHLPPDPAYVVDRRRLSECLDNLESLSGE